MSFTLDQRSAEALSLLGVTQDRIKSLMQQKDKVLWRNLEGLLELQDAIGSYSRLAIHCLHTSTKPRGLSSVTW